MKKFILSALAVLCAMQLGAKDYNASLFGIKSNGTTLNTSSIQKAIDYIHSEGGGRLVFYVGRYLTGSINLRANVTIQLNEGAVLLGSTNPYDYPIDSSYCALVRAVKVDNVAITGKGVIDGQGREASYNLLDQIQKGIINDPAKYDRPDGSRRARTLYFRECKDVTIDGITSVAVNGQDLGFDGYLDIGLYDTMKDLFVNFVGAVVFSTIGYFYIKHRGQGKLAKAFIPTITEKESETPSLPENPPEDSSERE